MRRICEMRGVRTYGSDDDPVELWFNDEAGRLTVVAYNEAGYSGTKVDLFDLLDWVQAGPGRKTVIDHGPTSPTGSRINSE